MFTVIMSTIFAIGCAVCATFTYYNGTIFPILSTVFMNTMYIYTVIECNIEKTVKRFREYNVSQYDYIRVNDVNHSPQHIFISHNEVIETRDSSELELMKVNNNVYVCSYFKPEYPTLQLVEPSNVKFISFDVIFEDDSTEEGSKMFSLDFANKSGNYLHSGNRIDKYLIWYLIKQQYGECYYGKPYTVSVIDGNINIVVMATTDMLYITSDGYTRSADSVNTDGIN